MIIIIHSKSHQKWTKWDEMKTLSVIDIIFRSYLLFMFDQIPWLDVYREGAHTFSPQINNSFKMYKWNIQPQYPL